MDATTPLFIIFTAKKVSITNSTAVGIISMATRGYEINYQKKEKYKKY